MPSLMLRDFPSDLLTELRTRAQNTGQSKDDVAIEMMRIGLRVTSASAQPGTGHSQHVYTLTLKAMTFSGKGPEFPGEDAVTYEVLGMPPGQEARINRTDDRWRALTWATGGEIHDCGTFETPEAARVALQERVNSGQEPR